MYLIGDVINASSRQVAAALRRRDPLVIADMARRQMAVGCTALDLCAAGAQDPADEAAALVWLVETVRGAGCRLPLWIDTTAPRAARAGLEAACRDGGCAVLNGVSLEPARLSAMLDLARPQCSNPSATDPAMPSATDTGMIGVVGQCLTSEGIPRGTEARVRRGRQVLDLLLDSGWHARQVFVDLCLLNIAVESDSPAHVMRAVLRLRYSHPEAHFTAGIRNFGWGLAPAARRHWQIKVAGDLLGVGLDAPLLDPLTITALRRRQLLETAVTAPPSSHNGDRHTG